MNIESKQLLNWGFAIILAILTYNFTELTGSMKRMNDTLTTIMIQNQDIIRRVTILEQSNERNVIRWKEYDDITRNFFEIYELHKKK